MKKVKAFALALLSLVLLIQPPAFVSAEGEEDASQFFTFYEEVPTMLIGEPLSGKILFSKGAKESQPVASMSKLMTYYVVMDAVEAGEVSLDDTVKISEEAAKHNNWASSNYGLEAGMEKTVEELLLGLMVVSGNDAAVALAEHVSGTEEAFVQRMNESAQDLGLDQSHFVNATGLTMEDGMNMMSAEDVFYLTARILEEYPEVTDYAGIRVLEERYRDYIADSTIKKHMDGIPGTLGLKTGTTEEAGRCFTGVFDLSQTNPQVDFDVVTVVMGAEDDDQRWRTTKELVDFAAGSFARKGLVDASIPITRYDMPTAQEGSVILYPAESFSTITYANYVPDIRYEIYENVKAPTPEEHVFGNIYIYQDGSPIKKIDIVAHTSTQPASFESRLQRSFEFFFGFLVGLFQ